MTHSVPVELQRAEKHFSMLVAGLRPELHRYASRMVGSAIDGEDVVQDTLARAYYALSQMQEVPNLVPWLFRIAHNKAIDFLRARQAVEPEAAESLPEAADGAPLEERELAALAMSLYVKLPPIQRAAVILKDVIDYRVEDVSAVLGVSVPAVKSALHRGRTRLRQLGKERQLEEVASQETDIPLLARYVELFNARDWSGLRDMLSDEVRIDLLSRGQRVGLGQAGDYFRNYERRVDWRLAVGRAEGRVVVLGYEGAGTAPEFIVAVSFDDTGRVSSIRDFSYVPYVMRDCVVDDGSGTTKREPRR